MPIPELFKPQHSDFETDADWLFACGLESERYTRSLFQNMDKVTYNDNPTESLDSGRRTSYDESRRYGKVKTINDWLQDRPELLRKFKKYGASALFEI